MSVADELDETSIKAVQKALGEPVFVAFSDEAIRVRRNLLILAYITATYKLSGLNITSFRPLGIEFDNYPQSTIDTAIFILLLYKFVNFIWISIDAMQECRIRLTGTRVAFVTTAQSASLHGDYPNDPRQSSLMTWWKDQATKIGSFRKDLIVFDELAQNMHADATNLDRIASQSLHQKATILEQRASELRRKIDAVNELIKANRIPVSLERFERSYKNFSYSQLARWLLIDWGSPVVLGLFALYLTHPFLQIAQRLECYFM